MRHSGKNRNKTARSLAARAPSRRRAGAFTHSPDQAEACDERETNRSESTWAHGKRRKPRHGDHEIPDFRAECGFCVVGPGPGAGAGPPANRRLVNRQDRVIAQRRHHRPDHRSPASRAGPRVAAHADARRSRRHPGHCESRVRAGPVAHRRRRPGDPDGHLAAASAGGQSRARRRGTPPSSASSTKTTGLRRIMSRHSSRRSTPIPVTRSRTRTPSLRASGRP